MSGQISKEFAVRRVVVVGCILFPTKFNRSLECLFQETLDDAEDGIHIHGDTLNNLRYADDAIIAEGLQRLLDRVVMGRDSTIEKQFS